MSVSQHALERLDAHWAVAAIPAARGERAHEIAQLRLVHGVIGRQMEVDTAERPDDTDNLQKTAMAYELAAIEGIDALLHPGTDPQSVDLADQAQAGAFRAYELLRVLPAPFADHERIFHVLHHGALAYCSDAVYMLQGEPPSIDTELDQHFESARKAAQAGGDATLDVILRWLHVASRRMVASARAGVDRTDAEGDGE